MSKNTWGFALTKINIEEDEFESLLEVNTGEEKKTKSMFEQIKSNFPENKGEPEVVIDLLDSNDDIIDDYAVTLDQAKSIAQLFGHVILSEA
ncbi:hypothetical protein NST33_18240 [Paenibacillus sp. FSL L8-0435]|uniref:hypothetical protein n=1 Tax=Paenibacillus sp. FSL L8-0435 TaxID=2954618 RepID=UPI0030DD2E4E